MAAPFNDQRHSFIYFSSCPFLGPQFDESATNRTLAAKELREPGELAYLAGTNRQMKGTATRKRLFQPAVACTATGSLTWT